MTLLGEIVEKDGMICLQTGPGVWYPLDGASGIAEDFREAFTCASRTDIGRQVHRVKGVLYLETIDDAAKRRQKTMRFGEAKIIVSISDADGFRVVHGSDNITLKHVPADKLTDADIWKRLWRVIEEIAP